MTQQQAREYFLFRAGVGIGIAGGGTAYAGAGWLGVILGTIGVLLFAMVAYIRRSAQNARDAVPDNET